MVFIFAFLMAIGIVVECVAAMIEIFAADTAIAVEEDRTTLNTEGWQGGAILSLTLTA